MNLGLSTQVGNSRNPQRPQLVIGGRGYRGEIVQGDISERGRDSLVTGKVVVGRSLNNPEDAESKQLKAQVLIEAAFPTCENARRLGASSVDTAQRFPLTNGWGRSCCWNPPPRLQIGPFLKSVAARKGMGGLLEAEANGSPVLPPAVNEVPLLRSHGDLR